LRRVENVNTYQGHHDSEIAADLGCEQRSAQDGTI
jgi:hypothetical protein